MQLQAEPASGVGVKAQLAVLTRFEREFVVVAMDVQGVFSVDHDAYTYGLSPLHPQGFWGGGDSVISDGEVELDCVCSRAW